MIIRGTTPTLSFELPFAVSGLAEMYITISQKYENILINKTLNDCTASGNTVDVTLSQSDTLKLIPDKPCFIQVRTLDAGGVAKASEMVKCMVGDILKEGEIGG